MDFRALIILAGLSLAAAASEPPVVVTRSADFALEWTAPTGPLRLHLNEGKSAEVPLPLEEIRYGKARAPVPSEQTALPFVSPDGNWIFVPTRDWINLGPRLERYEAAAVLLRCKGTALTPAVEGRFERAARIFIAQELKLTETPPVEGSRQRSYHLEFGDWSSDSARLLVRLTSDLWDAAKDERLESEHTHYCYFNTVTGAFEMTERLRASNHRVEEAWQKHAGNEMYEQYILHAEALGQEGPEPSIDERLAKADAELNAVYTRLLAKTPPSAQAALRAEERRWLLERETFAEVYVAQSWSGGPGRRTEGVAIATEQRTAALQKRLAP